jgi:hypothetical protein
MFIVVLSSRSSAFPSENFLTNDRGLLVSSKYGFGLMDAGRIVELSQNWINVPQMATCSSENITEAYVI